MLLLWREWLIASMVVIRFRDVPDSGTPDFVNIPRHVLDYTSITDNLKDQIEKLSKETRPNQKCTICISNFHKLFYLLVFKYWNSEVFSIELALKTFKKLFQRTC